MIPYINLVDLYKAPTIKDNFLGAKRGRFRVCVEKRVLKLPVIPVTTFKRQSWHLGRFGYMGDCTTRWAPYQL